MSVFTDAEKAQIRQVLGYSELFHDVDTRLENQMLEIGTRSPDAKTRISASLVALTAIDARLVSALDNLDLVRAEDVTFLGPAQLDTIRAHGRMLIQQISITLQCPVMRDYYSTGNDIANVVMLG